MKEKNQLAGIFPPLVTPFTPDGQLDGTSLQKNIHALNDTGLKGYVVLGSNGEYVYLNRKEKLKTIETVLESRGRGMTVLAGTGCESLQESISLTREAGRMGVDGALVITPSFFKGGMTPRVLGNYYQQLAEAVEIPVLIYQVPKNTGITIPSSLVVDLAQHPNIVGIKDSTGNLSQLGEIIADTASLDFQILVGTASVLFSAVSLGAVGGVLALANIAPRECVAILDGVQREEYQKAREIQLRMLPVNIAVTNTYGVPGLKYALDLLGFQGGLPRQPLLPLTHEEKETLKSILKRGGLL